MDLTQRSSKLNQMPRHSLSFEAIGTLWSIETEHELSRVIVERVHARIAAFDATYSRFRSDSLVGSAAHSEGSFTFPDDAAVLFACYEKLYDISAGKVTPLIGEMLERAGYDANYSFTQQAQKILPHWEDVMHWEDPVLTTTQPIVLDVGAAGKGYLVDLICGLLDEADVQEYVVDASGDLRHKGTTTNLVGLEDPREPGKVIGAVDVMNKSLCASASNRRAWGDGMHHIFDPDKGESTTDIIATWVMADTGLIADGIATALFFVEPKALAESFNFDYVRMYLDGTIDYSHGFEGNLYHA